MARTQNLDHRARKVLGFFVAKGLLISPTMKPNGAVKLTIEDCLQVAADVEPRVLAVLPAALIHFPRTFLDYAAMPHALREVVDAIGKGEKTGPDLRWATFAEMRRWAFATLKDKRTKSLHERKVRKTYRLSPRTAALLEAGAKTKKATETEIIEKLVEAHLG